MVRVSVDRTTMYTDQYLSFNSHHPLQYMLGVLHILYGMWQFCISTNRCSVKDQTHQPGIEAIGKCWTFTRVKKQLDQQAHKPKTKPRESKRRSTLQVTMSCKTRKFRLRLFFAIFTVLDKSAKKQMPINVVCTCVIIIQFETIFVHGKGT